MTGIATNTDSYHLAKIGSLSWRMEPGPTSGQMDGPGIAGWALLDREASGKMMDSRIRILFMQKERSHWGGQGHSCMVEGHPFIHTKRQCPGDVPDRPSRWGPGVRRSE